MKRTLSVLIACLMALFLMASCRHEGVKKTEQAAPDHDSTKQSADKAFKDLEKEEVRHPEQK